MTDYIRREDAILAAKHYAKNAIDRGMKNLDAVDDVVGIIEEMGRIPAADVAEVVRCKYCVYLGAPLSGGCYDCKKYMLPYCRPDDFCSYGERKGGISNVPD